jgi:hypothetical protein
LKNEVDSEGNETPRVWLTAYFGGLRYPIPKLSIWVSVSFSPACAGEKLQMVGLGHSGNGLT